MAFEALVTVGGYDFPEPSTYNALTSDLVDSGRNVEGMMVGSVIRENVSKVEISWKYLTVEQWSRILQCFKGRDKFVNEVYFFDPVEGKRIKKNMYVSDRKANIFKRDPVSGAVVGWVNVSLSLIEV
jgi:hypothetical protein